MEQKRFYQVRPENLLNLKAKIAFLQKRVTGSDLQIKVLGSIHTKTENGVDKAYIVDVTGKTPTISGYTFIAKIKHNETMNLVCQAPGSTVELPASCWTLKSGCDHCGTKRTRNNTVILQSPTGELKQIGKNCLADFLRSDDYANHLAMIAELEQCLNESEGESMKMGKITYRLRDLISSTVAGLDALKVDWIGKNDRHDLIDWATCRIKGNGEDAKKERRRLNEKFGHGKADEAKIEQVYAFWESSEIFRLNSFQRNLKALFQRGEVTQRELSLAIWVGLSVLCDTEEGRAMKLRAADRAAQAQAYKEECANLVHVGTVGEKVVLNLKVVSVSTYESIFQYGPESMNRVSFQDEAGNILVWFTGNAADPQSCDKDKFYQFKATIKAHGDFKEVKQTVLTRVSLVSK